MVGSHFVFQEGARHENSPKINKPYWIYTIN
jgi:hypothetical protein